MIVASNDSYAFDICFTLLVAIVDLTQQQIVLDMLAFREREGEKQGGGGRLEVGLGANPNECGWMRKCGFRNRQQRLTCYNNVRKAIKGLF